MRAVIRIRSGIGMKPGARDTLRYLRLNRVNHCVLVPEGKTYDGMLQKVKDYVTWGEIDPATLTNLLIRRGRLTGGRQLTNKHIKESTEQGSAVKYAEALISGKADLDDIKDMKPVFRLHPPIKGFRSVKRSFKAGGDLGYRGEAINDLIMRMLGPAQEPRKAPVKGKTAPAKAKSKPKAAAGRSKDRGADGGKKPARKAGTAKKKEEAGA